MADRDNKSSSLDETGAAVDNAGGEGEGEETMDTADASSAACRSVSMTLQRRGRGEEEEGVEHKSVTVDTSFSHHQRPLFALDCVAYRRYVFGSVLPVSSLSPLLSSLLLFPDSTPLDSTAAAAAAVIH